MCTNFEWHEDEQMMMEFSDLYGISLYMKFWWIFWVHISKEWEWMSSERWQKVQVIGRKPFSYSASYIWSSLYANQTHPSLSYFFPYLAVTIIQSLQDKLLTNHSYYNYRHQWHGNDSLSLFFPGIKCKSG